MARLHTLLMPYKPTDADPWDRIKAAHLLNRAGFGGTPEEIDKIVKMGPTQAVAGLLDFPDASAEEQNKADLPNLAGIAELPADFSELRKMFAGKNEEERKQLRQKFQMANRQAVIATAAWWLKRMAAGPHPLQEKLTLFWHGHFTTSAKDERSAMLIWNQNELLRRQSAGNFGTFVKKISRDPAMLDYLNNSQNRKAHPNENYARELMELFTLGIGNYSEDDIKQAARAFTGWAHDGADFVFRKFDHDTGEKAFFGYRGNFDGDDIIEIILHHPACARYIATKLYKYFASESVDEELSKSLGDCLRDAKYELRPLLKTILSSKAFYQPGAIGAQIKSPIQLVTGTVRLLERELPPSMQLAGMLNQMGQVPLNPPNVKGWPGGHAWISTSTLFVRYNTGVWLAGGGGPMPLGPRPFQNKNGPNRQANPAEFHPGPSQSVETAVDAWVERLIQRPIDPQQRRTLLDAMDGRTDEASVRNLIQLIVSMPEYQLC